jgi:tRNA G26 N,N-dimethylase Trm1
MQESNGLYLVHCRRTRISQVAVGTPWRTVADHAGGKIAISGSFWLASSRDKPVIA